MADTNRRLLDASIAHQIALLRHGRAVARDLIATLNAADDELLGFLSRRLRAALAAPGGTQRDLISRLYADLATINAAVWDDVEAGLLGAMAGLVVAEESWQSRLLGAAIGAAAAVELSRLQREQVLSRYILGRTLEEQAADMAAARLRRIEEAIGSAVSTGAPWPEALAAIEGKPLGTSRDALDTVARTDVVAIADATSHAVYEESGGAVQVELWVSVLDSQTTPICRANSGATRPIGAREWSNGYAGDYPAHLGERSVIVPQTPAAAANLLTFPEWLILQPKAEQERILGPARFRLWRSGRVSIRGFVDLDTGEPLTLEELAA